MKLLLLSLLILSIGIPGIMNADAATVFDYQAWLICIATTGILATYVCGPPPVVDPLPNVKP